MGPYEAKAVEVTKRMTAFLATASIPRTEEQDIEFRKLSREFDGVLEPAIKELEERLHATVDQASHTVV